MTKWELAQMMGAELVVDRKTKNIHNTTLTFGDARKYWHSDESIDYEFAAELVFDLIRKAVNQSRNVWSQ